MFTHQESKTLPYRAEDMHALVGDVSAYPEFLPWCVGARIRDEKDRGKIRIIEAELLIAFKGFRERFGSRVVIDEKTLHIDAELIDGPFKTLRNNWRFEALADDQSNVSCYVEFEFKSIILQTLIGVVFHEAMTRLVSAFETRARELYG